MQKNYYLHMSIVQYNTKFQLIAKIEIVKVYIMYLF